MDVKVWLDGEVSPRGFAPPALSKLGPEAAVLTARWNPKGRQRVHGRGIPMKSRSRSM
jgi:hypothetical protein